MISTREFYTQLEGVYSDRRTLDERVREEYIKEGKNLPPGWSLRSLLKAADVRGWIIDNPDGTACIAVQDRPDTQEVEAQIESFKRILRLPSKERYAVFKTAFNLMSDDDLAKVKDLLDEEDLRRQQ